MGGHPRELFTEQGKTNRRPKRQVLHRIVQAPIVVTGVCRACAKQQGENQQRTDETAGRKTRNYEAWHGPLHRCSRIQGYESGEKFASRTQAECNTLIADSYGFNSRELPNILRIVAENRDTILRAWHEHFGNQRPI
jgi:hypothetical protein